MLKAFVIRDDEGKFRDLFDVLKVAKSLGEEHFRVKQNVVNARQRIHVVRVWGPDPVYRCYVALVEASEPDVRFNQGNER